MNKTFLKNSVWLLLALTVFENVYAADQEFAGALTIEIEGYPCPYCDRAFILPENARRHVNDVHIGRKIFSCNICGRLFAQNSNLKAHEKRHTGEKPFACDQCDRRFTRSNLLKNHQKNHTGQGLFVCDTCDVEFLTQFAINRHNSSKKHQKNAQKITLALPELPPLPDI